MIATGLRTTHHAPYRVELILGEIAVRVGDAGLVADGVVFEAGYSSHGVGDRHNVIVQIVGEHRGAATSRWQGNGDAAASKRAAASDGMGAIAGTVITVLGFNPHAVCFSDQPVVQVVPIAIDALLRQAPGDDDRTAVAHTVVAELGALAHAVDLCRLAAVGVVFEFLYALLCRPDRADALCKIACGVVSQVGDRTHRVNFPRNSVIGVVHISGIAHRGGSESLLGLE